MGRSAQWGTGRPSRSARRSRSSSGMPDDPCRGVRIHRLPGEEVERELALRLRPDRAWKRRDHRSLADLLRLAFGVAQKGDKVANQARVADFDLHLAAGRPCALLLQSRLYHAGGISLERRADVRASGSA